MKRFMSMVLAALMALSMFTGCGGSTTDSSVKKSDSGNDVPTVEKSDSGNSAPIEITYCYWGGAVDAKARGEIADLFNASQDEIFVKKIPIDNADYVTKIQAYFAAGNEPDVIQSSADYGDVYVSAGKIADLSSYVEQAGLTNYFPERLVDDYTYDGKIYAVPFSFNTFVISYNKRIFDQNNVPYPTNDWTEEDFVNAAKKLTYGEGVDKVWGFYQGWSVPTLMANLYGTSIFDIENMKLHAADNPAFVDAFHFMANLIDIGVAPDAEQAAAAGGGLTTGKFAMELSMGVADLYNYNTMMEDEIGLVQFPVNDEYGRWQSPVSNVGFYISETSQKKDAAWKFIEWVCKSREAQEIIEVVSLPACKDLVNDETYLSEYPDGYDPYDKALCLDFSNVCAWPLTAGVWAKLMNELQSQWELVLNREKTVDQAIQDFQSLGDQVLAKESK
jgi:multiple sugar transport system substrate-binding protein